MRLSNVSPLDKPSAQAAAATNSGTEDVIDYAQYAETYTQPSVALGSGDFLKTVKGAALDKFAEWGSTSPEGSGWRKAMGISYALTDAMLPGSYGEAALGAGAGPLIGKAVTWGSSALRTTVSRYAPTSWAAEDLGSLAAKGVANTANWLAPPAERIGYNSLDRLGLVLRAVPEEPSIAGQGIKLLSPRYQPGVVTHGAELVSAAGRWLDAGTPTPIPLQVARQLNGQGFNTFPELQAAIWKAIAKDADLRIGFKQQAIGNMAEGNAPYAPLMYQNRQFGERYNLHHIQQIRYAGEVYNLSNIRIVSPKMHTWIHHPEVLLK